MALNQRDRIALAVMWQHRHVLGVLHLLLIAALFGLYEYSSDADKASAWLWIENLYRDRLIWIIDLSPHFFTHPFGVMVGVVLAGIAIAFPVFIVYVIVCRLTIAVFPNGLRLTGGLANLLLLHGLIAFGLFIIYGDNTEEVVRQAYLAGYDQVGVYLVAPIFTRLPSYYWTDLALSYPPVLVIHLIFFIILLILWGFLCWLIVRIASGFYISDGLKNLLTLHTIAVVLGGAAYYFSSTGDRQWALGYYYMAEHWVSDWLQGSDLTFGFPAQTLSRWLIIGGAVFLWVLGCWEAYRKGMSGRVGTRSRGARAGQRPRYRAIPDSVTTDGARVINGHWLIPGINAEAVLDNRKRV